MAKENKMNQAEESLNEKTDISTPLSEFVRKFKKTEDRHCGSGFHPVFSSAFFYCKIYCSLRNQ